MSSVNTKSEVAASSKVVDAKNEACAETQLEEEEEDDSSDEVPMRPSATPTFGSGSQEGEMQPPKRSRVEIAGFTVPLRPLLKSKLP